MELLRTNGVEVLVDTAVVSVLGKRVPHFDRESAERMAVAEAGIRYLYLGDVVGGKAEGAGVSTTRTERRAVCAKVAESAEFLEWDREIGARGADQFRVAMMCSEENPAHCHRRLLIGRVLMARGAKLVHVRGTGEVQDDADGGRGGG